MDEKLQIIKLCGVCGHKIEYNECHRLFNACKNVQLNEMLSITKYLEKK